MDGEENHHKRDCKGLKVIKGFLMQDWSVFKDYIGFPFQKEHDSAEAAKMMGVTKLNEPDVHRWAV